MEKNIVEVVMNNKGEVVEKVADYIGVFSFAKTIEALYRECLEDCDNPEGIVQALSPIVYIAHHGRMKARTRKRKLPYVTSTTLWARTSMSLMLRR